MGSSPMRGPKDAPVTLVLFSDVQCPFCARLEPTLAQLRTKYAKELRVVFKHNPLPFHPHAEPAAQLAIEARAQKGDAGFFAALDAMFADNRHLEDADLKAVAQRIGLDVSRAMAAVHGHTRMPR